MSRMITSRNFCWTFWRFSIGMHGIFLRGSHLESRGTGQMKKRGFKRGMGGSVCVSDEGGFTRFIPFARWATGHCKLFSSSIGLKSHLRCTMGGVLEVDWWCFFIILDQLLGISLGFEDWSSLLLQFSSRFMPSDLRSLIAPSSTFPLINFSNCWVVGHYWDGDVCSFFILESNRL